MTRKPHQLVKDTSNQINEVKKSIRDPERTPPHDVKAAGKLNLGMKVEVCDRQSRDRQRDRTQDKCWE